MTTNTRDPDYYRSGRPLPSDPDRAELAAFVAACEEASRQRRQLDAYIASKPHERAEAEAAKRGLLVEEYLNEQQNERIRRGSERLLWEEVERLRGSKAQAATVFNPAAGAAAREAEAKRQHQPGCVPWETKAAPVARLGGLELKMVGTEARFFGYASTYGPPPDLTGDIVDRGAFTATLAEAKAKGGRVLLPVFWNHDVNTPIGGIVEAHEDAKGLYVEGLLALDTPAGQQAYSVLSHGYLSGLSIGYKTVRSTHDRDGTRHLANVSLREISVVSFPANPRAGVTGVSAN